MCGSMTCQSARARITNGLPRLSQFLYCKNRLATRSLDKDGFNYSTSRLNSYVYKSGSFRRDV